MQGMIFALYLSEIFYKFYFCLFYQIFRGGFVMLLIIIVKGGFDCLFGEYGAVHFVRRKSVKSFGNSLIRKLHCLGYRFAFDKLGCH